MTEAEQKQKDWQKRHLRDGVEKGYQRVEVWDLVRDEVLKARALEEA